MSFCSFTLTLVGILWWLPSFLWAGRTYCAAFCVCSSLALRIFPTTYPSHALLFTIRSIYLRV